MVHEYISPGHFLPFKEDAVLVGIELSAVLDTDRGNYKSHIQGHLFAEHNHPVNKIPAVAFIGQGNQAIAKLHFNLLHVQQTVYIFNILIIGRLAGNLCLHQFFRSLLHQALLVPVQIITAPNHACGYNQYLKNREAGYKAQARGRASSRHKHPWLGQELLCQVLAEAVLRSGPGHHHTGGNRYEQGRYLGHQTVANGGCGVNLHDILYASLAVHDSHNKAAHKVDKGDDNGDNGIALYKLGGTVHGAEEVSFPLDFRPAFPCLLFVDKAAV